MPLESGERDEYNRPLVNENHIGCIHPIDLTDAILRLTRAVRNGVEKVTIAGMNFGDLSEILCGSSVTHLTIYGIYEDLSKLECLKDQLISLKLNSRKNELKEAYTSFETKNLYVSVIGNPYEKIDEPVDSPNSPENLSEESEEIDEEKDNYYPKELTIGSKDNNLTFCYILKAEDLSFLNSAPKLEEL
ncbi:MAG: hypothetical protein MHMPM18_003087 [Marteilia pararefringens]